MRGHGDRADLTAAESAAYSRGVRVTLSKSGTGYRDRRIINAILREAAEAVLNQCPIIQIYALTGTMPVKGIGYGEITGSLSEGGPHVLLVRADRYLGNVESWDRVSDVAAAQERQEAAARAEQEKIAQQQAFQQAELQRQQAEARAQAIRQQQFAQLRAQQAAESARWWASFYGWVKLASLFAVVAWLFSKREAILRWYYFAFHPHPAAPLVQAALTSGNVGNGKAIAAALAEMPDNRILRGVRIAQGEELVRQMQEMSRWHLAKLQAKARDEHERAAVQSIQEAIALAAAALERAKAYYRASQTAGARY